MMGALVRALGAGVVAEPGLLVDKKRKVYINSAGG